MTPDSFASLPLDEQLAALARALDSRPREHSEAELLEISGSGQSLGGFEVTSDGAGFLVTRNVSQQNERREPIVILNWFEELKSRTRTVSADE